MSKGWARVSLRTFKRTRCSVKRLGKGKSTDLHENEELNAKKRGKGKFNDH